MTQAQPTQVALVNPHPLQRHLQRRRQQEQVQCCSIEICMTYGVVAGHLHTEVMKLDAKIASLSLYDTLTCCADCCKH